LNRSTFVVWEIKRNVSVVCVCFVAISSLVLELLKKCRFGSEWDNLYKLPLKIIILEELDRIDIIIFFYVRKYEYQPKIY
jgi:hypothetical protein